MRIMIAGTVVTILLGACQKQATPVQGSPVLARVGDSVITVQDMEARLASFSRSRAFVESYAKPEKRKELLKTMIDAELLYQEARRKGYHQDPAVKREAVNRMLQNEVDAQVKPESISDAEIEKYYNEHASQYTRLDQVRVTQIVVKDQKKAAKVASAAKALPKGNLEALRALVKKYSEDEASKAKGGDIGLIDSKTSSIPKPLLDAALAAQQAFEVLEPIKTDAGYTVAIVTQKLAGFSRSVQEVKPSIQSSLLFDVRRQKRDALTTQLREMTQIQIDEAQLANMKLSVPPAGPGMPPRVRPPHGMPGGPALPGKAPPAQPPRP